MIMIVEKISMPINLFTTSSKVNLILGSTTV